MRYDSIRRPEHATLGDAAERFTRDPDAFTAGVQYALDRILERDADTLAVVRALDLVGHSAAVILNDVHQGQL